MATPLTFRHACELLQQNSTDSELVDKLDHLLSFVLIVTSIAFGPATPLGAASLAILSPKGEVTKLGKWVAKRLLARKNVKEVDGRQERLVAAHVVICYASFFEVLSERLAQIGAELGIDFDRVALSKEAAGRSCEVPQDFVPIEPSVTVPHPGEGFVVHVDRLRELYIALAKAVQTLITSSDGWLTADEKTRDKAVAAMSVQLVDAATARYKARYADLATRFHEFFIWASLDHADNALTGIKNLSAEVRDAIALLRPQKSIDLGFSRLESLVSSIPAAIERHTRDAVLRQLQNGYQAAVEAPVIQDKPPSLPGTPELRFPAAQQIFVPQSFKVLRYGGTERLEDPATWEKVKSREDLGLFLVSFLSSPHSELSPLIILGHPGSGKSLLTKVIAARLGGASHTVLRIELRDVKADVDVASQIEEQIKLTVNRDVDWAVVADEFETKPGLVILDGYDELLQASGKVHSGYLLKAKQFQQNELAVRRRPVRVIVTSRVTLIDKAAIPKDSTIVKLEEFDEPRQQKWAGVWNGLNESYFRESNAERFTLPANSPAVEELARQPLLLLMLAIYDSEGNPLKSRGRLDRTALYNNLIHRFVERERTKDATFRDAGGDSRRRIVDREVERLGVPAISMFNRRSLSILESHLNSDLAFFEALPEGPSTTEDRSLSAAALLLGSFFFVHESKSAAKRAGGDGNETDVAFEFLHNTFGEFLAADFLLRRVVLECKRLHAYRSTPDLETELARKLNAPDGLPRTWFGGLVYTPLFSRPVVMQMMREWLPKRLAAARLKTSDFRRELQELIDSQLRMILQGCVVPNLVLSRGGSTVSDLPLMGHLAVYTVNLITIAAVLVQDEYVLDEKRIGVHPDGARPWDRLTALWRAWFSLDNLFGVVGAIAAKRVGDSVHISHGPDPVLGPQSRLGAIRSLADALNDAVVGGLAGLAIGVGTVDRDEIDRSQALLESERVSVHATAMLGRVLASRYSADRDGELLSLLHREISRREAGTSALTSVLLAELARYSHDIGIYEALNELQYVFRRVTPRDIGPNHLSFIAGVELGDLRMALANYDHGVLGRVPSRTLAMATTLTILDGPRAFVEELRHEVRHRLHQGGTVGLMVAALRIAETMENRELRDHAHDLIRQGSPLFVGAIIDELLMPDFRFRVMLDSRDRDRHMAYIQERLVAVDRAVVAALLRSLLSSGRTEVYDRIQFSLRSRYAMVAEVEAEISATASPRPPRRPTPRRVKS